MSPPQSSQQHVGTPPHRPGSIRDMVAGEEGRGDLAERRERVREMTRAGRTALEIAVALHVSPRTVIRDRRAAGVSGSTPPPVSAADLDTARRLLDEGASYCEVARTIGTTSSTVARHLPGRGWSPEQVGQWANYRRSLHEKGVSL